MAQGSRWAATEGGQAPPVPPCDGVGGTGSPCPPLPAHGCARAGAGMPAWPNTPAAIALSAPTLPITAAAGTCAAHHAGDGLLPRASSKLSAWSNANQKTGGWAGFFFPYTVFYTFPVPFKIPDEKNKYWKVILCIS